MRHKVDPDKIRFFVLKGDGTYSEVGSGLVKRSLSPEDEAILQALKDMRPIKVRLFPLPETVL